MVCHRQLVPEFAELELLVHIKNICDKLGFQLEVPGGGLDRREAHAPLNACTHFSVLSFSTAFRTPPDGNHLPDAQSEAIDVTQK